MNEVLLELEPRSVWSHFQALTRIPRPSGQEAGVADYIRQVAAKHGWEVREDAAGNLVVKVPASAGLESAPTVVLQSHMDMVCEKNKDVDHDFERDPIRVKVEGDWVTADGTTLGADNGIGLAAALAAATDPEVRHGPLELLFTVDEETGLTGAQQLDPSIITGRLLLNLDSEEDGVLFVGCAGGADTHLHLRLRREDTPRDWAWIQVDVSGLRGGHSGLNIHENRGNAVKLLARALYQAMKAGTPLRVGRFAGGSKHNAIPREAEARVAVPADRRELLEQALEGFAAAMRDELGSADPEARLRFSETESVGETLPEADSARWVRLLLALPHGVLAMSRDIPGLVETSSNLAVARLDGEGGIVVTSSRSSVRGSMEAVLDAIRAAGELAGADVETRDGYPGWKPDLDSRALQVMREAYRAVWGREPKVTAIHAGLECGLLGDKVPGLDMVSFGPQIEGAHSPDERVSVSSVARFWHALRAGLERLAAPS